MARNKAFNPTHILEKAMDLFWLKGYEATSIDDLCDIMEIKRGSLYNAFGDKRTLFFQALEHYVSTQSAQPSLSEITSGYQAIAMMFRAVVDEVVNEIDCRGCFIVNTITELAATDPEIAQFGELQRRNYEQMFYDLLVMAEQHGEIAPDQDLVAKAQFLVNAFYGLRVTAKVNQDRTVLENIVNTTLSLVV